MPSQLAPREQRIVQVTTIADKLTPAAVQVVEATADPGLQTQAQTSLEIEGVPALHPEIADDGDPVEVGKTITYRIEVTNTGSLPAKQVSIQALLPAELRILPGKATGPSQPTIAGQTISFAPVDVEAQKMVRYVIQAEAMQPGDVRFRMEMRSSGAGPAGAA